MQPSPKYAVLLIEKLSLAELNEVQLHNARQIPVSHADASVPNGARVLRLRNESVCSAVMHRISSAGAAWPARSKRSGFRSRRIWAFEVLICLTPGTGTPPSAELQAERGTRFLDEVFGESNVVAIWQHLDEATPHIHAVVVPICEGFRPGRPARGKTRKISSVVSWNRFSGSCNRVFRRDSVPDSSGKGVDRRCNPTLAEWQSRFAETWEDWGYRRGAPSKRTQMPIKWIYEELGRVRALADDSIARVESAIRTTQLSASDAVALRTAQGSLNVGPLLFETLLPRVREAMAPLVELASRGVQLDAERQARADLADKLAKVLESGAHAPPAEAEFDQVHAENRILKERVQQLEAEANRQVGPEVHPLQDGDVASEPEPTYRRVTEGLRFPVPQIPAQPKINAELSP